MNTMKNKRINLFFFYLKFIKKHTFKFLIMMVAILGIFPIDIVINSYLSRMFINKMVESNISISLLYILIHRYFNNRGKFLAAILGKLADILYVNFIAIFKSDMRSYLFLETHDRSLAFFLTHTAGEIVQKIII